MKQDDQGGPALYIRLAVWLVLAASWPVMLLKAWDAFATLPSPERLATSRLTAIPTLRTVILLGVRSAAELCVVLGLAWPWRTGWYGGRVGAAAMLFAWWFFATAPLTLTRLSWVHRRWLAFLVIVLVFALASHGVAAGIRRLRTRSPPEQWEGP